jgi:hypothetical protein
MEFLISIVAFTVSIVALSVWLARKLTNWMLEE